jgi:hypothetical protein
MSEPRVVQVHDSDECRAEEGIAHLHHADADLPQTPATPGPPPQPPVARRAHRRGFTAEVPRANRLSRT